MKKDPRSNVTTKTKLGAKYTARGFRVYGELVDSYGSLVSVQESSNGSMAAAWIFCKPCQGEKGPTAPHLTRAQARHISRWLEEFADGYDPALKKVL